MSIVDGCVLVVCSGANGRFRPLADWTDEAVREHCAWDMFGHAVRATTGREGSTKGWRRGSGIFGGNGRSRIRASADW